MSPPPVYSLSGLDAEVWSGTWSIRLRKNRRGRRRVSGKINRQGAGIACLARRSPGRWRIGFDGYRHGYSHRNRDRRRVVYDFRRRRHRDDRWLVGVSGCGWRNDQSNRCTRRCIGGRDRYHVRRVGRRRAGRGSGLTEAALVDALLSVVAIFALSPGFPLSAPFLPFLSGGVSALRVHGGGLVRVRQLPAHVTKQRAAPVMPQARQRIHVVAVRPQVIGPFQDHGENVGTHPAPAAQTRRLLERPLPRVAAAHRAAHDS